MSTVDAGQEISPAQAQAALRVGASIVLALVLAGPTLLSAARGERDFTSAAWWFLLSFVAARVATTVLWAVWIGYRRSIDDEARRRETESLVRELDRRRADRGPGVDRTDISADPGMSN